MRKITAIRDPEIAAVKRLYRQFVALRATSLKGRTGPLRLSIPEANTAISIALDVQDEVGFIIGRLRIASDHVVRNIEIYIDKQGNITVMGEAISHSDRGYLLIYLTQLLGRRDFEDMLPRKPAPRRMAPRRERLGARDTKVTQ